MVITRILFFLVSCSFAAVSAQASTRISGAIRDATGRAVTNADVSLLTPALTTITSARTDAQGGFALDAPSAGNFLLLVRAPAFDEVRRAVTVVEGKPLQPSTIVLEVGAGRRRHGDGLRESVDALWRASHPVNVISADEIGRRVKTVVAEAVQAESAWPRSDPTTFPSFCW